MEIPNDIQNQLKDIVLDAIIKEFIDKGHNLTGKGIKSLEAQISSDLVGVTISILGESYMAIQNEGRARGGKMPPLNVLMDWVKRRGIASEEKKVKGIAFAIGMNMKRIGMHSDGASGKSGIRNSSKLDVSKRNYINQGVEKVSTQMTELVFAGMEKNFQTTIENVFNQTKSTVINL